MDPEGSLCITTNNQLVRLTGHVACMGESKDVYRVLVRKSEGNRPLGRSRPTFEDNIKIDIQKVGCGA